MRNFCTTFLQRVDWLSTNETTHSVI